MVSKVTLSLIINLVQVFNDRKGISTSLLHCQGISHASVVVVINIMMTIPFSQDTRGQRE